MQNNVTELTQKLLRALDSNYNVIDMPTVIEVISLLEKVSITKELLETTRLGKHINELRRNISNESLAKRAKELLKKWRNMVLPESNGQLKPVAKEDVNLNQMKIKKRPAKEKPEGGGPQKRTKLNGTNEFELSDNSNSSFKDVVHGGDGGGKREQLVLINSDSNSSFLDFKNEPLLEQQQPKKRGRKKGSRNHRSLLDEAETSFSNKMAVSRGNAKVKTTQELIASLQNKKTNSFPNAPKAARDDLTERAAILTERVSIIDQKLNTNANRYKNSQKKIFKNNMETRSDKVIESGIVVNISSDKYHSASNSIKSDDEVIVVDDVDNETKAAKEAAEPQVKEDPNVPKSLSVEEALKRLPPIDRSALNEDADPCSCQLKEYKSDFSIGDDEPESSLEHKFEFEADCRCPAKTLLAQKYRSGEPSDERVSQLHDTHLAGVNGNFSLGCNKPPPELTENSFYVNVVPNVNTEHIPKNPNDSPDFAGENYKKYSISQCANAADSTISDSGDNGRDSSSSRTEVFREWHEVVETASYNGEVLRILPYVIID